MNDAMPPTDDDHTLLHRYATARCENSFRQLVARHVDLVYSAALRQTRASHHAQEVAQSVFIELSRAATRIRRDLPLAAWLYTVTRRKAIDLIRRETARATREQLAASDAALTPDSSASLSFPPAAPENSATWTHLTGVLDEAMIALAEKDRAALLLRFFANKPLRDIGAQLNISEDAAQKRIARALARLRENFSRRGFAIGAGTLATALSAHAVQTAPLALGSTIAATALLAPPATATAISSLIAMTTLQKVTISALVVSTAGLGFFGSHSVHQRRELNQLRGQLQQARDSQIATEAKLARVEKELTESDATLAKADDALTHLTTGSDGSLNTEVFAWTLRVQQLKAWSSRLPERAIPEMSLLTDSDWLQASREAKLNTEEGARQAIAHLRSLAKRRFVPLLQTALENYKKVHHGALPSDIQSLAPFFQSTTDPRILARYHVVRPDPANPRLPSQLIVENGRVDDDYDTIIDIQRNGGWNSHSSSKLEDNTIAALQRYRQDNQGTAPASIEKLLPYYPAQPSEADLARIKDILAYETR